MNKTPFKLAFPRLFRIALSSNGSVADHWDLELASWSIIFRRLLKEEEILDFQALLGKIADRSILKDQDRRLCSLGGSGKFRVKSLTIHLSPSSPMDKMINKALWKCNSPRRVNIFVWIMLVGHLNVSSALQKKLLSSSLSPSIFPLRLQHEEDSQHLFFSCKYSANCWEILLLKFNLYWVFGGVL